MNKKISFLLFLSCIIFPIGNQTIAHAQTQTAESIVSYDSHITVNTDNSADITETITYNTGDSEHHGIYRDIYPYSSQKRKMNIGNVTVTDENGNPYLFTLTPAMDNFRIKIGDPNSTFTGQKTYVIHYHTTRAIGQFTDFDEMYWNVTGNAWSMPIQRASASITLPHGASVLQSSCYYGARGNTTQCTAYTDPSSPDVQVFNAPNSLNPGEGLTIAVGFPKGFVLPYSRSDSISNFFDIYWHWILAIILPILTTSISLYFWYRKGRDDRKTRTIIPYYDVPEGLTPMEMGAIVNEKISTKDLSAEIIYLATQGYIHINQIENTHNIFLSRTDYELIRLKDFSDLPNMFDQQLLKGLFSTASTLSLSSLQDLFLGKATVGSVLNLDSVSVPIVPIGQPIKISRLKNTFYKDGIKTISTALDSLVTKGYYKNLGRMKTTISGGILGILVFELFFAFFLGGMIGAIFLQGDILPISIGLFISMLLHGIIYHFSPSKTDKGVSLKEIGLGLKDYLQIAEKDRLIFHNAPEKKPEIFEKLLPYAMVFGVTKIWAKEFEGIYTTPPSWYSGSIEGGVFSASVFSNSLSHFSSFATSNLTPPSSGSGGGGSSGGGGGGGGGGSW